MNKFKFSPALLCAVLFLTVATHAQIKTESPPPSGAIELPKPKREFKPILKPGVVTSETEAASETEAPKTQTSQQTYVRPTKDERLKRYFSEAFGVPAVIGATFGATVNQITNSPPEWERNIGGFGKRFASSYGTNVIRNSISFGISEAFKLDNRYERMGGKNIGKRIKHAFLGSYTTRTRNGKRIPDFPYVTGTYAAAIIANEAWYPNRYNYQDGLRDGTVTLGARFGITLLREFVFPK